LNRYSSRCKTLLTPAFGTHDERFGGGGERDRREDVVGQLQQLRGAGRVTSDRQRAAPQRDHRPDPLDGRLVQRAGARARGPARDRAIDDRDARAAIARSISFTNGTPTVQVLTRSFIALPPARPSVPNATSRNAANVGSETNTISRRSARSCGDAAAFEQRPHRPLVDVIDRQAVAGIEQLVRHRLAHGAEA
jgi:hypothetical protein